MGLKLLQIEENKKAIMDNLIFMIENEDEKYNNVCLKIVDLKDDEDGLTYEIELPKDKVELFKDEKFNELIQKLIGDYLTEVSNRIFSLVEEGVKTEEKLKEILDKHNAKYNKEKSILEQFVEKSFFVQLKEDKCIAIEMESATEYDMSDDELAKTVIRKVFPRIIVN